MSRSNKNIKPLLDLAKDIMNLDGLKLTSAEREIISALSIIANRYDDVYSPEIEGIQNDIEHLLEKLKTSASLIVKLSDKVKIMPTKDFCGLHSDDICENIDVKIKSITLPKLIADFIRAGKWNLMILISATIVVAPLIRIILLSLAVFFIEKTIGINIIEVWPFLGHLIK